MKYLSLFSGIGGFELGIQQVYEQLQNNEHAYIGKESQQEERPQGGMGSTDKREVLLHDRDRSTPLCIGYSEIDKYAIQTYQSHFNHTNYGDIKLINESTLPDFDLLVGGFPCQAFSIAGKRKGFEDTRGTLFFEIARILRAKQPRLLLLENVKGLLSHDNGNTFRTIISTLNELGYDLQWQVLNSKNFGVPQNRERVFIVGHLRGTNRPEVFPITQGSEINLKYYGGVISAREQWLKDGKTFSRNFSQGQRIYDTSGISQCLAGQAGGQGGKTGLYATEHRTKYVKSDISGTLTSRFRGSPDGDGRTGVIDGMQIRRLTPTECERLQGFPDGWTKGSDTQRYKQCGNAVTVNVIQAIMERLML